MTDAAPGPDTQDPENPVVSPSARTSIRAATAAGMGTIIEWYEYGLYGLVAALAIGPLFFPDASPVVGLLASFGTLAVGYLARPIGGIVLGALSDRWGRRPVLLISIIAVGGATTLIGVIPPFASIGIWAPIILVVLRLVQGFGAGAELAGAITIVNESAQLKRKGFFSSLAMLASGVGGVLGVIVFTIVSIVMPASEFATWGWRIPFLLAGVFTIIGLLLRRRMHESPEFEAVKREREAGIIREARANPLVALARAFRASPRNWFAGFLLPSGFNVTTLVVGTFGITYLIGTIGIPQSLTLVISLTSTVSGMVFLVIFGALGDRMGSKRVLIIGVIGAVLWAFPYYLLIDTGSVGLIILANVVLQAFAYGAVASAHTVLMPAYFKAEFRSAGLFSSRELQGALIAGPAPLIATALAAALGGAPWLVAGLFVVAQLMSLAGVLLARPWLTREAIAETPALAGSVPRE